ncbi:MAG: TetR/AcrR family transcriptional regulator [Acidobacteriota bacterium]
MLQAAVHIFERKGYQAASVREVAEMAGVTKPTLYYYFGSKEGLLIAILEDAIREFDKTLSVAVARTGTARERLMGLCEDVFSVFELNIPVVRVAHTVFLGPVDAAPAFDLTAFERLWRESLQRIVEDGQAGGEFRAVPPIDVVYGLMGLVDSCLNRQMHRGLEPVSREALRRIIGLLLDGVSREQRA